MVRQRSSRAVDIVGGSRGAQSFGSFATCGDGVPTGSLVSTLLQAVLGTVQQSFGFDQRLRSGQLTGTGGVASCFDGLPGVAHFLDRSAGAGYQPHASQHEYGQTTKE
jgi:hypothetical protein